MDEVPRPVSVSRLEASGNVTREAGIDRRDSRIRPETELINFTPRISDSQALSDVVQ